MPNIIYIYIYIYNRYVYKGWAKIHPIIELLATRSNVLPISVYPSVNPILLTMHRTFLMGAAWCLPSSMK
jgi:hypothetical protein